MGKVCGSAVAVCSDVYRIRGGGVGDSVLEYRGVVAIAIQYSLTCALNCKKLNKKRRFLYESV